MKHGLDYISITVKIKTAVIYNIILNTEKISTKYGAPPSRDFLLNDKIC